MKRCLLLFTILFMLLFFISCERTDMGQNLKGIAPIKDIPLEYGALKGVTTTSDYPGWAQLWFQDEAGTIRMVRVDWMTNRMHEKVLTIPRIPTTTGGN